MWVGIGVVSAFLLAVPALRAKKKRRQQLKDVIPLDKMQPPCDTQKPLLVLVGCGCYSPITNMHLRIFEQARNWLTYEQKTWDVVGGLLSPVHDGYGKAGLTPAPHRIRMCELGSASSDWIAVATWETVQEKWTPTLKVLEAYENYINESKKFGDKKVRVKLICGADLLESFTKPGLWKEEDRSVILGKYGVVVIERQGESSKEIVQKCRELSCFADNIDIVPQRISNTISSTGVREHLSRNLSVQYLIPDPVIEYIYENGLYGHTILQDKIVRKLSLEQQPPEASTPSPSPPPPAPGGVTGSEGTIVVGGGGGGTPVADDCPAAASTPPSITLQDGK